MIFPKIVNLSFFGLCRVLIPFLVGLYKKLTLCFSHSYVQKTNQQSTMATVMIQVTRNFYANYSKYSIFISANTYQKHIVCMDYCIVHHDKLLFLPNCRYHIILGGNKDELLQKLDAICFKCQNKDCLYNLYVTVQRENCC